MGAVSVTVFRWPVKDVSTVFGWGEGEGIVWSIAAKRIVRAAESQFLGLIQNPGAVFSQDRLSFLGGFQKLLRLSLRDGLRLGLRGSLRDSLRHRLRCGFGNGGGLRLRDRGFLRFLNNVFLLRLRRGDGFRLFFGDLRRFEQEAFALVRGCLFRQRVYRQKGEHHDKCEKQG